MKCNPLQLELSRNFAFNLPTSRNMNIDINIILYQYQYYCTGFLLHFCKISYHEFVRASKCGGISKGQMIDFRLVRIIRMTMMMMMMITMMRRMVMVILMILMIMMMKVVV